MFRPNPQNELQKSIKQQHVHARFWDRLFGTIEDKFTDYQQIFILFVGGWIVSLSLAHMDRSKCLDDCLDGVSFTFRTWLWANFFFSLAPTLVTTALAVYGILQRNKNECLIKLGLTVLLILVSFKFVWIVVGIFIFLIHLEFPRCSDFVIVYCSGQFLVFLSALSYLVIKGIFIFILTTFPCFKNNIPYTALAHRDETKKSAFQEFFDNFGDKIKKQIVFLGMISWIYSIVLAKKDRSQCLDDHYKDFSFSLRQWLLVDGISALVIVLCFSFLALRMLSTHDQNQGNDVFQRIISSTKWLSDHKISGNIFLLSACFKLIWLIAGLFMFLDLLDIDACRQMAVDYLIIYFVWFIYLAVVICIVILKQIVKNSVDQSSVDQTYVVEAKCNFNS